MVPTWASLQKMHGIEGAQRECPTELRDKGWLIAEVERLTKEGAETAEFHIRERLNLYEEIDRLQSALTLSRAEGKREGLEAAAKIADEHCCDDCKSSGTLCEEKIAAAIREAAQEEEGE